MGKEALMAYLDFFKSLRGKGLTLALLVFPGIMTFIICIIKRGLFFRFSDEHYIPFSCEFSEDGFQLISLVITCTAFSTQLLIGIGGLFIWRRLASVNRYMTLLLSGVPIPMEAKDKIQTRVVYESAFTLWICKYSIIIVFFLDILLIFFYPANMLFFAAYFQPVFHIQITYPYFLLLIPPIVNGIAYIQVYDMRQNALEIKRILSPRPSA